MGQRSCRYERCAPPPRRQSHGGLADGDLTRGGGARRGPRHARLGQTPPNDTRRGVVHDGLVKTAPNGVCKGTFALARDVADGDGRSRCTHGPDPAPDGVDVRRARPAAGADCGRRCRCRAGGCHHGCRGHHPVLRQRHRRLPGAGRLRPGVQRRRPVPAARRVVRELVGRGRRGGAGERGRDRRDPSLPVRHRLHLHPRRRSGDPEHHWRRQLRQHGGRAGRPGLRPPRPQVPRLRRRQRLLRHRRDLLRRLGERRPRRQRQQRPRPGTRA